MPQAARAAGLRPEPASPSQQSSIPNAGLVELVERGAKPSAALDREIALAVGWHRYSPSEIGRKNPGWIAPEDFIGEYVRGDGRRTPKLDSLHGTDIWREPRPYSTSIDAAMTLVPPGHIFGCGSKDATGTAWAWSGPADPLEYRSISNAATPALALCAAALKAKGENQ
ncbi:hypothetical protein [Sphingopyxis bauzanensis]|uniref:hypothetical protein n=1 Tax=Sphingopyxis bauzanensis TaxID=651663 RepID=UPI001181BDDD|nr:hypothetical protein [Sphingopyxis bauzanensis]